MSGDRLPWSEYALRLAETASSRSEDPYHKVGAALLRPDHTIAALGFNGAPAGVEIDWSDRDGRRQWMIHAEANALRYVKPGECFLLASTMMPCLQCVLLASSYGIKKIVYREELDPAVYDREATLRVAAQCGIEISLLEGESA